MIMRDDIAILVKEIITYKVMTELRLNNILASREKRLNLVEPKPDEIHKLQGKIEAYKCTLNLIMIQGLVTLDYVKYMEGKTEDELKGGDNV